MDIQQRKNEYDFEHKQLIGTGSGGNRVYKIQHVHTKKVITFIKHKQRYSSSR
jgi:hypothetical protein